MKTMRRAIKANTPADELEFAVRRGEPEALARAAELPGLRRIEEDVHAARSALDRQIALCRARTIRDIAIKLRFFAAEQGYLAKGGLTRPKGARFPFSVRLPDGNPANGGPFRAKPAIVSSLSTTSERLSTRLEQPIDRAAEPSA
jgi:hypothetical protein